MEEDPFSFSIPAEGNHSHGLFQVVSHAFQDWVNDAKKKKEHDTLPDGSPRPRMK
jgi:hypothetical protein